MTIEPDLTEAVRAALTGVPNVTEVKMFGGVGFMLNGNMVVAASSRGLLARVGDAGMKEALARAGSAPMVMNGRTMTGYIRIAEVRPDRRTVKAWVALARAFVETLPPKKTKPRVKPAGAGKAKGKAGTRRKG